MDCGFESHRPHQRKSVMKTSLDYVELAGLRVALANAKINSVSEEVIAWVLLRIEELENK